MGYPDGTKSRTKTTDGDALAFLRVAAKGETRIKTSRQARPKLPANVLLLIPAQGISQDDAQDNLEDDHQGDLPM